MDNPTRSAKPVTPLTPVKGSWEDLLYRGQQLAATHNQEGTAILRGLIDRLAKMSDASLSAGNHRLRTILIEAINSLTPYLLYNQRYDEAIVCLKVAEQFDQQQTPISWRTYQAMALIQSGAIDDGFALLREVVRNGEPEQWLGYVLEAIQRQRIDIAEEGVKEAEHTLNRLSAATNDTEGVRQLRAALAYAKAQLAAVKNNPDEASAWMEYSLAQHETFLENLAAFYLRLVEREQFDEALKWVQRDQLHPIRSKSWRAYILYHLGRREEAERLWRQVVKMDIVEQENIDLLEYVLAHYFLGDREGLGLGITLNLMESSDRISSLLLFLAGLGWAMRGNEASAHANFHQAQMQMQALAVGHKLISFWWRLCADLIDKDDLSQYTKYFDLPQPDEF